MKNKLPLKHKKEIIAFTEEYYNLARPQEINITIPRMATVIKVVWDSGTKLSIQDYPDYSTEGDLCIDKRIKIYNKHIKTFCKKADRFGKKHFNNEYWLWDNVLWCFRPKRGEKFKVSNYYWY